MKIAFFYLLILLLLLSLSVSCKDNSTSEEDPYNKVTIGQQIWMTDNLNADKFRNGDIIPETRTIADWKRAGFNQQPAWCYYNNDSINKTKFGKLYNWYAVNDPRGLAPKGWHIPFDAEWTNLANNLGGINIAGGKLKSSGTLDWQSPNTNATNSSGFAGLPGGSRNFDGSINSLGRNGFWWTATQNDALSAWYWYLGFDFESVARYDYNKENGFSVRCIKD